MDTAAVAGCKFRVLWLPGQPQSQLSEVGIMSFVGNCKFNYFAAQMTTHEAA
jgi:uncharacterized protein (DUF2147 family)